MLGHRLTEICKILLLDQISSRLLSHNLQTASRITAERTHFWAIRVVQIRYKNRCPRVSQLQSYAWIFPAPMMPKNHDSFILATRCNKELRPHIPNTIKCRKMSLNESWTVLLYTDTRVKMQASPWRFAPERIQPRHHSLFLCPSWQFALGTFLTSRRLVQRYIVHGIWWFHRSAGHRWRTWWGWSPILGWINLWPAFWGLVHRRRYMLGMVGCYR